MELAPQLRLARTPKLSTIATKAPQIYLQPLQIDILREYPKWQILGVVFEAQEWNFCHSLVPALWSVSAASMVVGSYLWAEVRALVALLCVPIIYRGDSLIRGWIALPISFVVKDWLYSAGHNTSYNPALCTYVDLLLLLARLLSRLAPLPCLLKTILLLVDVAYFGESYPLCGIVSGRFSACLGLVDRDPITNVRLLALFDDLDGLDKLIDLARALSWVMLVCLFVDLLLLGILWIPYLGSNSHPGFSNWLYPFSISRFRVGDGGSGGVRTWRPALPPCPPGRGLCLGSHSCWDIRFIPNPLVSHIVGARCSSGMAIGWIDLDALSFRNYYLHGYGSKPLLLGLRYVPILELYTHLYPLILPKAGQVDHLPSSLGLGGGLDTPPIATLPSPSTLPPLPSTSIGPPLVGGFVAPPAWRLGARDPASEAPPRLTIGGRLLIGSRFYIKLGPVTRCPYLASTRLSGGAIAQ
ncbi:hypothetical protein G9A89_000355 [Geosiphon pyriformis]|nr:hypothetical protein G9A89_000355 [Geosiphon pyriformis]